MRYHRLQQARDLIMTIQRVQKKIAWTPEDRARHQAIRETFKDKPTLEELTARGELPRTRSKRTPVARR